MTLISIEDFINGAFEFGAVYFMWRCVLEVMRTREIRGVSLYTFIFYGFWAFWNTYFYGSQNQLFSQSASIPLAILYIVFIRLAYQVSNGPMRQKLRGVLTVGTISAVGIATILYSAPIEDWVNSGFEALAAFILLFNVKQIYVDKQLKGFYPPMFIMFTAWGLWNLYYYPHLNLEWSFVAGIFVVTVNAIYTLQIYYYSKIYQPAPHVAEDAA